MTQTFAALLGSISTAIAIFGGGLAVEAYKRSRDRAGMALALAGAIDAILGLIEARDMAGELGEAVDALEAGQPFEFASLIRENAPFEAITLSYTNQIGGWAATCRSASPGSSPTIRACCTTSPGWTRTRTGRRCRRL